jgi:hypothetical protein
MKFGLLNSSETISKLPSLICKTSLREEFHLLGLRSICSKRSKPTKRKNIISLTIHSYISQKNITSNLELKRSALSKPREVLPRRTCLSSPQLTKYYYILILFTDLRFSLLTEVSWVLEELNPLMESHPLAILHHSSVLSFLLTFQSSQLIPENMSHIIKE